MGLRFSQPLVALGMVGLLLAVGPGTAGCQKGQLGPVQAADRLVAEGRWEAAAAAYSALGPETGEWQTYGAWRAATIYRDVLKDRDRARSALSDCARTYADDPWGYTCQVEYADLLRDWLRPHDAIGAYRMALELRPRGMHAEHCLVESGRAYQDLGEFEQARVEWNELLERFDQSPLRPRVLLHIAQSYDLGGRHKEALRAYLQVSKQYPNDEVSLLARFGEAEALEQLGELDEAIRIYETLQGRHPNPDAIALRLSRLRARESRRDAGD